jgi:ligand-binding SRPBCC domain-containing protein
MPAEITRHPDGGWLLTATQWLPAPLETVWPFFASAENLEKITPPWMQFHIRTPGPIDMREGALIDYRLKVRGIPLRWRTLIETWLPPHRFVDVQLRGPYKQWHHTHTFTERDGGTLCGDRVHYKLYGGPLAPLVNRLLVQRDVQTIFAYRERELERRFGKGAAENPQHRA